MLIRSAVLLLVLTSFAAAQAPPAPVTAPAPPPMNVPKTNAAIDLDGALNDAAWAERGGHRR